MNIGNPENEHFNNINREIKGKKETNKQLKLRIDIS